CSRQAGPRRRRLAESSGGRENARFSAAGSSLPPYSHQLDEPERSLAWYAQYWPKGRTTTYAGFPAFTDGQGFYLLYTQVPRQAPGAFDRSAQRSVPQSAFWTFGSTFEGPDTGTLRDRLQRLDPKQFELVTLYGGPGGTQTATHALALPM